MQHWVTFQCLENGRGQSTCTGVAPYSSPREGAMSCPIIPKGGGLNVHLPLLSGSSSAMVDSGLLGPVCSPLPVKQSLGIRASDPEESSLRKLLHCVEESWGKGCRIVLSGHSFFHFYPFEKELSFLVHSGKMLSPRLVGC